MVNNEDKKPTYEGLCKKDSKYIAQIVPAMENPRVDIRLTIPNPLMPLKEIGLCFKECIPKFG